MVAHLLLEEHVVNLPVQDVGLDVQQWHVATLVSRGEVSSNPDKVTNIVAELCNNLGSSLVRWCPEILRDKPLQWRQVS